ncbi:MAG: hypothetical protein M3460_17385 [Actinomycetota bacterium]|nr:hypothetical protein [Actinomycetota bacterium]
MTEVAHDRLRAPLLGRDDVDCHITRDTLTQATLATWSAPAPRDASPQQAVRYVELR